VPVKYTFAKITQFLDGLPSSLGVVGQRLLREMLFGLLVSKTVLVSEITRALEEKIDPKDTYKRVDHALGRYDFTPVALAQTKRNCALIADDHVICLDGSDIAKPFAKKLEALAKIRDGSKNEIVPGYLLMGAVAVRPGGYDKNPLPLLFRPYSAAEEHFVSDPYELHMAIEDIHQWTGGRGIFAIDRGADSGRIFNKMLGLSHRFVVRLKANKGCRYLISKGSNVLVRELVERVTYVGEADLVRIANGKRRPYHCDFGSFQVQLKGLEKDGRPLWCCVYNSTDHPQPMVLLTTEPADTEDQILFVLQCYMARWSVEEFFRFVKQSFKLEQIRCFKWGRNKNLVHLVFIASCLIFSLHQLAGHMGGHIRTWLIREARLVHKRRSKSPMLLFNFYAYAAGLGAIFRDRRPLFRLAGWFHQTKRLPLASSSRQLSFQISG
jgi:hypothetical protein